MVVEIDELERKANAYKASVNVLCERDGLPPMFPDDGSGGGGRRPNGQDQQAPASGVRPAAIGPDTFHGKRQQTAVRELFAIRRAADPLHGPAKPDEILAGLKAGGYVVQARSDGRPRKKLVPAILRQQSPMLRKRKRRKPVRQPPPPDNFERYAVKLSRREPRIGTWRKENARCGQLPGHYR